MEKWKIEFDKKFTLSLQGAIVTHHEVDGTGSYQTWAGEEIKSFLAEQISKAKEQGRAALLVELYNVDPNNRSAAIVQRVSELLVSSLSDTPNEKPNEI